MQRAVDTVRKTLSDFRVAVTDRENIVAASGMELDQLPEPAQRAIDTGELPSLYTELSKPPTTSCRA